MPKKPKKDLRVSSSYDELEPLVKRPVGRPLKRPTQFTKELGDMICSRVADGEPLVKICAENGNPSYGTVWLWGKEYPEFAEALSHAREAQQDHFAESVVFIADSQFDAQKARNMMDARRWYAGKVAPKKWGDKIEIDAKIDARQGPSETLLNLLTLVDRGVKVGD